MCQLSPKGGTRRLTLKHETPLKHVWKARFRGLDVSGGSLQFEPSRCCTIITATAVLHNMRIFNNTPLASYEEQLLHEPDLITEVPVHFQSNAGLLARDRLNK